jgi:hypothetical protein
LSSKEALLAKARVRRQQKVHVPEWEMDVVLQSFSAGDRDYFERIWQKPEDAPEHVRGLLLARSLWDEESNTRMFADREAGEISSWDAAGVQRVFEAIVELNGLGKATADKVDAAAKNSESDPSGD